MVLWSCVGCLVDDPCVTRQSVLQFRGRGRCIPTSSSHVPRAGNPTHHNSGTGRYPSIRVHVRVHLRGGLASWPLWGRGIRQLAETARPALRSYWPVHLGPTRRSSNCKFFHADLFGLQAPSPHRTLAKERQAQPRAHTVCPPVLVHSSISSTLISSSPSLSTPVRPRRRTKLPTNTAALPNAEHTSTSKPWLTEVVPVVVVSATVVAAIVDVDAVVAVAVAAARARRRSGSQSPSWVVL